MRRIVQLFVALSLLGAALPARAEEAATKQSLYVLIYSQGPGWKPDMPMSDQGLKPHYLYWKSLRDAHKMFLAGPFTDANGGLVVLRAKNMDDARDMMAHDPAVIDKIFVGDVHAWAPGLDSGQTAKDFLAVPE